MSEGAGIRSFHEAVRLPWHARWLEAPFFAIATTATAVFANDTPPAGLEDVVPLIAPRPVLLIAAGHGAGGEEELNPRFYAAAGDPRTLWQIPEAGHTGA